jgi:hypothetical protein
MEGSFAVSAAVSVVAVAVVAVAVAVAAVVASSEEHGKHRR